MGAMRIKREIGTCSRCRAIGVPLDDGKHLAAHVARWMPGRQCDGSGKLCAEQTEANRATSLRRRSASADEMRADAEVAHDALASGLPFPFAEVQRLRMIDAAIFAYRVKFPLGLEHKHRGFRPRGNATLIAVPRGRPGTGPIRSLRRENMSVDIYCTLCRVLLWTGARKLANAFQISMRPVVSAAAEVVAEHTTLCAMRMLARLDEYVAPDRRRPNVPTIGESGDVF